MEKIISGLQTGVDLAAADFALEVGLVQNGYVPLGRRNELGIIPTKYNCEELPTPSYKCRTYANVEAADFTLVIRDYRVPISPGTEYTFKCLKELGKWDHWCEIGVEIEPFDFRSCNIATLLRRYDVINIAGPRESKVPGIYQETLKHLRHMWEFYVQIR